MILALAVASLLSLAVTCSSRSEHPHLADYIVLYRKDFSTREAAEAEKTQLQSRGHVLSDRRHSREHVKLHGPKGTPWKHLVAHWQMHGSALTLFDLSTPTNVLQGPFCSHVAYGHESDCFLANVTYRYRRAWFSSAWRELESRFRSTGHTVVQVLLQDGGLDSLRNRLLEFWPDEHRNMRKAKFREIQNDLHHIGHIKDPSCEPAKGGHPVLSERLVLRKSQRKQFFARLSQEIIDQHPEVYTMEIDEILARGWAPAPTTSPDDL